MAWARAEGKLMYHCWLFLRLMSWTLVGNPMGLLEKGESKRWSAFRQGKGSYIWLYN